MREVLDRPGAANVMGAVAVVLATALGFLLRLEDPLGSPVVPAEDPYTHMVLVKEHLANGALDPLSSDGQLYPPGMHAFVAVLWTFTGLDLYQLVRFAPIFLGTVGVVGTAVLLWRYEGRVAAFVGALAFALAPEIIFRTTMMAPTAIDLALVPFLFLALLEVLEGNLLWIGAAAPLSVYLVFAHPWVFGILAAAGGAFALFALVLPWPTTRSPRLSSPGFAASLAIVWGGLGLVLSTCGGLCGPGFQGILPYANVIPLLAPIVLVLSFLPSVFLAVQSDDLERWMPERTSGRRSLLVHASISVVLAIVLAGLTWPAVQSGLPQLVDLPRMLGWPLLGLAAFGFVALPFLATRLAYLGASLSLATYPMVIYNPLGSPFWPHRTVVYFGVGLVLLAGAAAGALAHWARHAWTQGVPKPSGLQSVLKRPMVALVPALLVGASLGGALFTSTPPSYPDGWYRLYEPCEMEAMEEVSDQLEEEPSAVAVAGDWRPAIVLSALTEDPDRVWYKEPFWTSERERRDTMALHQKQGKPLYVVEERHLRSENPDKNASFTDSDEWRTVDAWCSDEINPRHQVVLHEMEAGNP